MALEFHGTQNQWHLHVLSTTKEVWESIQQISSKVKDAAQIHELKIKIALAKQGNKIVTEYTNFLKGLWQEMDRYRVIEMKNNDDAATLKAFIEKDRTYNFLASLNVEYDQVRVQILGKDDFPSLNKVISIILAKESKRGVMLEPKTIEASTMVENEGSRGFKKDQPIGENGKTISKSTGCNNCDNLCYTFCKKSRHSREMCWNLNEKPPSKELGNRGG